MSRPGSRTQTYGRPPAAPPLSWRSRRRRSAPRGQWRTSPAIPIAQETDHRTRRGPGAHPHAGRRRRSPRDAPRFTRRLGVPSGCHTSILPGLAAWLPRGLPPIHPQNGSKLGRYAGEGTLSRSVQNPSSESSNLSGGTRDHLHKSATDQAKPEQGPLLSGPNVSGAVRPSAALRPPCAPSYRPSALPAESPLDAVVGRRLQTGDHLGVDFVQTSDRVAGAPHTPADNTPAASAPQSRTVSPCPHILHASHRIGATRQPPGSTWTILLQS